MLYVIPKWASQELQGREDYCLISKVNILNGRGQAGPYLISLTASPYISTWLVETIRFTWIATL